MLWPLMVLGHVALVTSRPPTGSSDPLTWDPEPELPPQQWLEVYSSRETEPQRPDPGEILDLPNLDTALSVLNEWKPFSIDLSNLDDSRYPEALPAKRGLSVLSRWKPFSVGLSSFVGRYPSRTSMLSSVPDMDFVSAQTRGLNRPVGQPLRWGRR